MLGNDVVDLRSEDARAGARHPRFDRRVFAREERARIARSGAAERLRWMLWAAKEAAYKVARKLDARSVFAPSRTVVRVDETLRGEVELPAGLRLRVLIRSGEDCVHAIASDRRDFESSLVAGLAPLPAAGAADESRLAREFAARAIARERGRGEGEIRIEKLGRIPRLSLRGVRDPLDLTLSHHGRFAAYACEAPRDLQRPEARRP